MRRRSPGASPYSGVRRLFAGWCTAPYRRRRSRRWVCTVVTTWMLLRRGVGGGGRGGHPGLAISWGPCALPGPFRVSRQRRRSCRPWWRSGVGCGRTRVVPGPGGCGEWGEAGPAPAGALAGDAGGPADLGVVGAELGGAAGGVGGDPRYLLGDQLGDGDLGEGGIPARPAAHAGRVAALAAAASLAVARRCHDVRVDADGVGGDVPDGPPDLVQQGGAFLLGQHADPPDLTTPVVGVVGRASATMGVVGSARKAQTW